MIYSNCAKTREKNTGMFWGRIKMMKIVTMEFLMKENS